MQLATLFNSLLIAEMDEEVRVSLLHWMFQSLGIFYGTLIPFSAFVLFLGAVAVVVLSDRPSVVAAYLVFLPLPLLIGVIGSLHGFINAFSVVAMSNVQVSPAEYAHGQSMGLFSTMVALLLSFPAYIVTAFGLMFPTIFAKKS